MVAFNPFGGFVGFNGQTPPGVPMDLTAFRRQVMTDGQLLIGQTGSDPLPKTVSGAGTLDKNGVLVVPIADPTQAQVIAALGYTPPQPLFDDFATVGNTTTSGADDDLYSHVIAGGTLAVNGDKLEIKQGGAFILSATSTRKIKLWFGGTAIFDTGALTVSLSAAWTLKATIMRESATAIKYMVELNTEGASLAVYTGTGELTSLTLSSNNTLKSTGAVSATGAANDITALLGSIIKVPAA